MVVKKSNIFGIALLLTLAFTSVSGTFANGGNNLVQLDLKKTSNNTVDVTLFTTNNYNDNVMVRKKSDNKYVILIPKVQSSGFSNSSLSGVKDLVSNIDVKTVNDTSGGYTKVTLITTKPLDIKTRTQKSGPVTEEQKEYRTLIAEANAVKNKIGKQEPPKPQKTEVTVNKAKTPAAAPAKETPKKEIVKQETKVQETKIKENKVQDVKQPAKQTAPQAVKSNEIKQEAKPQVTEEKQSRKAHLAELIEEVKQEKLIEQTVSKVPQSAIEDLPQTDKKASILSTVMHKSKTAANIVINKLKTKLPVNTPTAVVILIPVLGLIMLAKLIKASLRKSAELKESFIDHLASRPPILNTVKYNNIVNDEELSWQEKYQRYLDESARPVSRGKNKGSYTFIKTPAEPQEITQKRDELEKLVAEMPYTQEVSPEIKEVQNEEDAIQKTIKFKAFENEKASLKITNRARMKNRKSRFKKYEVELPLKEQKNVELGTSMLHSNPRHLKNANLDIADVDKRGSGMKFKVQDYIMSSVDEFFSILDKEQPAVNNATSPIASNSSKFKPSINVEKSENAPKLNQQFSNPMKQTNPISKLRNETKDSYLNGLIIKSGFNIDENKGFYVVNLEGNSALVGRINDEIFVLKKFDRNVEKPIQVRHDNANVYMVKAGGFKSLVEVNEDKMGVLIEL